MFCPRDDPFTCLGTYVVKQNDMDGGSYDTTSEVTAVSPNGLSIGNTTDHSAELIGAAGISVGETGHAQYVYLPKLKLRLSVARVSVFLTSRFACATSGRLR